MTKEPRPTLLECFASLPDPRVQRTQRHKLVDILAIAILGTTCGADTWVDIVEFGQAKESWLRQFLELPNGIPSHDTFGRVFARLDPEQFRCCFLECCLLYTSPGIHSPFRLVTMTCGSPMDGFGSKPGSSYKRRPNSSATAENHTRHLRHDSGDLVKLGQ